MILGAELQTFCKVRKEVPEKMILTGTSESKRESLFGISCIHFHLKVNGKAHGDHYYVVLYYTVHVKCATQFSFGN